MQSIEASRASKSRWVREANGDYMKEAEEAQCQSVMEAHRIRVRRQYATFLSTFVNVEDDEWFKKRDEKDLLDLLERTRLNLAYCSMTGDDELDEAETAQRREKSLKRRTSMWITSRLKALDDESFRL